MGIDKDKTKGNKNSAFDKNASAGKGSAPVVNPHSDKKPAAGEEFVTVEELSDMLKVNTRTIQRIIQRKEIAAVRVGRQWRFRREWVREWMEKNTVNREAKLG